MSPPRISHGSRTTTKPGSSSRKRKACSTVRFPTLYELGRLLNVCLLLVHQGRPQSRTCSSYCTTDCCILQNMHHLTANRFSLDKCWVQQGATKQSHTHLTTAYAPVSWRWESQERPLLRVEISNHSAPGQARLCSPISPKNGEAEATVLPHFPSTPPSHLSQCYGVKHCPDHQFLFLPSRQA
jgi:hypothetical protein